MNSAMQILTTTGPLWQETQYSEGGWRQTVRSVVPFRVGDAVKYGDHTLEHSTIISIASPLVTIDDLPYAFAVSMDHKIRVWNLKTRKIAYMSDILDQELDPHEQSKRVIDPFQTQLVKVFGNDGESAVCVTFSPLGSGQFKFWNITPAEDGSVVFADLFPGNVLEPQAPSSEIWTLADFSVVIDRSQMNSFGLWVLWKNNVTYRLHKLDFHSGSIANVRNVWKGNWMAMATETLRETPQPTVNPADSADGTDKWLEFILYPGRFTEATIETGLAIYERGLGGSKELSRRTASLPDRMCTVIASTTSLSRASNGSMDFEQFRIGTDAQWRRFYRLLLELDKQRGEAMSLVIDHEGGMPWVVLADGITAIRSCSDLERIWHNNGMVPASTEHVARPLFAAAAFRDSLGDQFIHACRARLVEEIFQEPSLTDPMRLRAFYEQCSFSTQIGDEEYSQLVSGLGGGFRDLTPKVYEAMLNLMTASNNAMKADPILPLAEFGKKLIVKGVQEIVELHRNICLDQFILLVLIEVEINHGEEGIQFETAAVFRQLVLMLQRLELIEWLASTQISKEVKLRGDRSNSITDSTLSLSRKTISFVETITILEGVMRHLFGLDVRNDETMPSMVTDVIVQICATNSVYEAPPAVIQCFLLVENRPDLALQFSRFTGPDSFSAYVRGRVCLAANDAFTASTYFKKAALGMGKST
jgi:nuclear pore complex protein Nup160